MIRRVALCTFLLAAPLAALAAAPPVQAPAPPPPGMNDPGVKPADTVPADKTTLSGDASKDANGNAAPQVTVRRQGEDTVEEYRQEGRITMIRITPKNGVAQTFMSSPDGKLVRDAKQGPVDPVYFTVYEWGK